MPSVAQQDALDRTQIAPPVIVKAADDPRLRRLARYEFGPAHLALLLAINLPPPPHAAMAIVQD